MKISIKVIYINLFFLLSFSLTSCGVTIGTFDLTNNNGKIILELEKKQEIEIWNGISISYNDLPTFAYQISISKDNLEIFNRRINALNPDITIGSIKTRVKNSGSISWQSGRILSGIKLEEGSYTIKINTINENLTILKNTIEIKAVN